MAELIHQILERHAVLQRIADRLRECIGEAGDRRAFLRHHEEDFARRAVFEEAHGDVALVARDIELVRERVTLVRQLAAHGLRTRRGLHVQGAHAQPPRVLRGQGLERAPHRPARHGRRGKIDEGRLEGAGRQERLLDLGGIAEHGGKVGIRIDPGDHLREIGLVLDQAQGPHREGEQLAGRAQLAYPCTAFG